MFGSDSTTGSSTNSEFVGGSVTGSDSASLDHSTLGTLVGFDSMHSVTKECFQPATLQSTEGNFQHYACWMCSMYTVHEDTPSNSA